MTIKIQSVIIEKDARAEGHWANSKVFNNEEVRGRLNVSISEGKVEGKSNVSFDVVSDGLKEKLYSVLEEIENELNGEITKKYNWSEIEGASYVSKTLNKIWEDTVKKADEIDKKNAEKANYTISFNVDNLNMTSKDQVEEFAKKFAEIVKRIDKNKLV